MIFVIDKVEYVAPKDLPLLILMISNVKNNLMVAL